MRSTSVRVFHPLANAHAGRTGDNSWSSPTVAEAGYELTGASPPPPPPSCTIEALSADPPSPQSPGTSVSIYGRASCDTGVRAIRFKVNGGIIYELGAPEATATWNSPGSPGAHTITVEAAGWGDNEWAYAASRSIAYELQSAPSPPSCSVQSLSISPTSGSAGTMFNISGSGSCDTGVRAVRLKVDGGIIYELGAPSASATWNSSGTWQGTHTATIEVAGWGDNNWSYAASSSKTFEVTGPQPPPPGPSISQVIFNPSGGVEVGQTVGIHIKVESSNPGAIRITVPCGSVDHVEHTVPEFDTAWRTPGCGAGSQTVRVCARHVNDPNWAYATCTERSYMLSEPPTPISSPSAKFWPDTGSIQQGQCTWLHWTTSNATTVDIDGTVVSASDDMKVCPAATKHYSLKAVGPGGTATRNITINVSAAPATDVPDYSGYFSTRDIIQIGHDVFVIVNGQRRLVPNPDTLDALGVPRSWIDNKGLSDSQLRAISQGADIPDVNKDYSGFIAFKNAYFSNTTPIAPATPTPTQGSDPQQTQPRHTAVSPTSPAEIRDLSPTIAEGEACVIPVKTSSDNFLKRAIEWLKKHNPLSLSEVRAREPGTFDPGECVQCAADWVNAYPWLPDSNAWPYRWDDEARGHGIDVNQVSEPGFSLGNVRVGDIVVWEPDCQNIPSPGHVAVVVGGDPFRNTVTVDECNLQGDRLEHRGNSYGVYGCMKFIHSGTGPLLGGLSSDQMVRPWEETSITAPSQPSCPSWLPDFLCGIYDFFFGGSK